MYKLIVVDDEWFVCEYIKNAFDWSEYGFCVTGTAINGVEALKMIKNDPPNVVITDIRMPEMDGLELAKEIKRLYPQIQVVILSAYNDFKYAQEAINLGVKGYLLKPPRDEDLKEIVVRLSEDINNVDVIQSDSHLNKEVLLSLQYDILLKDLLKGKIDDSDNIKKVLKNYDLERLNEYVRVIVCNMGCDLQLDTSSTSWNFITEISKNYWKTYDCPIVKYMDFIVIFLYSTKSISKSDTQSLVKPFVCFIEESIEKRYDIKPRITLSVGNLCHDIKAVSNSFNQALYSYNTRYLNDTTQIIFYQDLNFSGYTELEEQTINGIINILIENIFLNKLNIIINEIHDLFDFIERRGDYSVFEVQMKLAEIIFEICFEIKKRGLQEILLNKNKMLDDIRLLKNYNDLKGWFKNKIISISNEIKDKNIDNANWLVKKSRDYIRNQYSKKITLEEIAGQLYINPAYFSTVFKKTTGQNFVDYITKVRMEKAKELLSGSEYKIKEISEKVGYENYPYFCQVFKKEEGISPLEFRKRIINNIN